MVKDSIEKGEIMKKEHPVLKTAGALFVFLLFMFAQGAAVVIGHLEGTQSALIRGSIIWSLAIVTLVFLGIRQKGIACLGFVKMEKGSGRKVLYFIPLLVIAFSHFTAGLELREGMPYVLANAFFTLSVGMAEELYFRGIICNLWLKKGVVTGMLVSAILFGVSHLLNLAGGASIFATILQICFAFTYGLVFALLFTLGKSLIPCILLHALHDFCSFLSADVSLTFNIILGTIQFLILIGYFVYLLRIGMRKE